MPQKFSNDATMAQKGVHQVCGKSTELVQQIHRYWSSKSAAPVSSAPQEIGAVVKVVDFYLCGWVTISG